MSQREYNEFDYYRFGLRLGLNGIRKGTVRALGLRKALGKVTQPINTYSRFVEFYLVGKEIGIERSDQSSKVILDVGSPKLFPIYLSFGHPLRIVATDIWKKTVKEYLYLYEKYPKSDMMGRVDFHVADCRNLPYKSESFDIIFSISTIEHIEEKNGDIDALTDMARVVKPGGKIIITIPFGDKYIEQYSEKGHYRRELESGTPIFFQRIYDTVQVKNRLLNIQNLKVQKVVTIFQNRRLKNIYNAILFNENVRGGLGFMNPMLSKVFPREYSEGIIMNKCQYCEIKQFSDIYDDILIVYERIN